MSTDRINAQGGILQKVETTNGFSHTSPGKKHRTSVETIYINVYIYYICVCAHTFVLNDHYVYVYLRRL